MDSRCRLCAEAKPLNEIECTIQDRRTNVRQMLMDCCRWATFEASEYDNLPKIVCTRCFNHLKSCWQFANSVADAQQRLLDYWNDVTREATKADHTDGALIEDDATCVAFEFKMDIGDICYDVAENTSTKAGKPDADDGHDNTERQCDQSPGAADTYDSNSEPDADGIAAIRGPDDSAAPSVLMDTHRKGGDERVSFLCDTCGNESDTMKQFHLHRRLHRDSVARTFECFMCRRTLTNIESLKLHIRSHVATEENRFNCTACAASFARKDALKRHELGHTDIAYRGHCDICGKGFRTKADLRVSVASTRGGSFF